MDPRLSDFPCGIKATRLDRVSYVIILLVPTTSAFPEPFGAQPGQGIFDLHRTLDLTGLQLMLGIVLEW